MANDGKDLERIVHLIEQSISPNSVVKHNVDLPVIGSEGKLTRQCDVVIWTGQKPRQTTTIVEVQDRHSKVDINMFGGWVEKLRQVGAQHLICVSRHEFPLSIKEEALSRGGTVKLVTIRELDAEGMPFNVVFIFKDFDIKECKENVISFSNSEVEALGIRDDLIKVMENNKVLNLNDLIFSIDKKNLISHYTLCRDFFVRPEGAREGKGRLNFDMKEGPELYITVGGQYIRIGLDCVFLWEYEEIKTPMSLLSYEQNKEGILAWYAEIRYESKKGVVEVKLPFVKTEKGYVIEKVRLTLPENVSLSLEHIVSQPFTRAHSQ